MSTCWPRPVASRAKWAISAPAAASAAPCSQAWGALIRRGGPSLSRWTCSGPPAAHIVNSHAAQSRLGPFDPKGVMETWISFG